MAEERYERFAWSESNEWQDYLRNVYPPPTLPQVVKIKRKWYQKHIDPELSLEPPSASTPPPQSSVPPPSRPSRSTGSSGGRGLFLLPALLFCLWPYAWFIGKGLHVAIAAFSIGVFAKYGIPKLNLDYWRPVATDDDMHSVVYCLLLLIFADGLATQIPIVLGGACWVVSGMSGVAALQTYTRNVNMYSLASLKSDSEVALGVFSLLSIPAPNGSLVLALLMWQFLRMKYMLSTLTQSSFAKMRMYGDAVFPAGGVMGGVWEKLKRFASYMVTVEQGGQTGCSVM